MKQLLENSLYYVRPVENLRVYQVGDLESLSAVALGYGSKGSPLGSLGSFGIVKTPLMKKSAPTLKIRPLDIEADLHIHQRGGYISGASLKDYGEKSGTKLTNYQASIADLYADIFKKATILKKDK